MGKLSHLGVSAAQKRSTLFYANQQKPSALFRALFFHHHPVPEPIPLGRV
ncbi:hypothetical protein DFAR_260012 [Desulfarculales bacterium]